MNHHDTETEPITETTNIAEMTADQLDSHVEALDKKHKARMKSLRALARARRDEEESE